MNQWWQYWKGHLSAQDCADIVEACKKYPPVEGQVGHGGVTVYNPTVRRSQIRWIPRFDQRFANLFGRMATLFAEANRNAFGFDVTEFHEIQFTEYPATTAGHYDWHHDTTWVSSQLFRRKLSMVIQLSDPANYEGGELELAEADCTHLPNPTELKQQGTVIVFPSFLRHRVTPVTAGLRYSLVSWMEGPYFR
jgi:PKHD-type hydroxylase